MNNWAARIRNGPAVQSVTNVFNWAAHLGMPKWQDCHLAWRNGQLHVKGACPTFCSPLEWSACGPPNQSHPSHNEPMLSKSATVLRPPLDSWRAMMMILQYARTLHINRLQFRYTIQTSNPCLGLRRIPLWRSAVSHFSCHVTAIYIV